MAMFRYFYKLGKKECSNLKFWLYLNVRRPRRSMLYHRRTLCWWGIDFTRSGTRHRVGSCPFTFEFPASGWTSDVTILRRLGCGLGRQHLFWGLRPATILYNCRPRRGRIITPCSLRWRGRNTFFTICLKRREKVSIEIISPFFKEGKLVSPLTIILSTPP